MNALRDKFTVRLPTPLTQLTNMNAVQLAWDSGRYYLDIDVFPDGTLQWFFRDRSSNELDGTDDDEFLEHVPNPLLQRLDLVLR